MRFASFALCVETVLIIGIVLFVPYTEIDWKAYMEEVAGFLDGQLDYRELRGGTGPLVYPGGFVWIYSVLYYVTKLGTDIKVAQWIFAGVYLLTVALVLRFYTQAGLSWKAMMSLFISKRIRSLYVLRLFNDCWAMLLLAVAVTLIAGFPNPGGPRQRYYLLGCFLFSFAVSVKMSVLLFAPGMLYVMLRTLPLWKVVWFLFICALWQVLAGLPFLAHDHMAYLTRAFELGRVFTQRWSVNYQFLPPTVFTDPQLGLGLLVMTIATWVLLWRVRWSKRTYLTRAEAAALRPAIRDTLHPILHDIDDSEEEVEAEEQEERRAYTAVLLTFFEANLVGVAFARSLHYQFYTWFFFTIPFVLSYTSFPHFVRLMAFGLIRQGFENYPPTPQSSILLQVGFALALAGMLFFGRDTSSAPAAAPAVGADAAAASTAAPAKGDAENASSHSADDAIPPVGMTKAQLKKQQQQQKQKAAGATTSPKFGNERGSASPKSR